MSPGSFDAETTSLARLLSHLSNLVALGRRMAGKKHFLIIRRSSLSSLSATGPWFLVIKFLTWSGARAGGSMFLRLKFDESSSKNNTSTNNDPNSLTFLLLPVPM
ncbi:hypothetical protein M422DRAFT_36415 [Sphaerobolus stellatus SS14]|uniref:Uncharacterized protein n=1 Tax=Sphaerobolus stellatus (strain SS14) TaxID=990650 RepID=A0A0C9U8W2_SPHS4|nr:hypothetical protein M422DRAFT_36415 [Sphaerobolus stellatus SS14]